MTAVETRHFRIRGHVQRVGFRYATRQEARRLGLNGWVRNCPDNTVEATVTGTSALLDALDQWFHRGPPGAHVERVESSLLDDNDASERKSRLVGFEILR